MRKEKAEILMGELIGRRLKITKSTQRNLVGLEGAIVDETLNTLTIEKEGRERKIQKAFCVFKFGDITVDGKEILFRPEDRIKKQWRKFDKVMR